VKIILTINMRTRVAAALCFIVGLAAPAVAQNGVDVNRLPVDLDRIQRGLRESAVREEREGLNLRYTVEVYGQAPPIQLFGPEANLGSGPVPYGAPTHREMIEHVTPKEFRAPAADLSALIRWLAERAKK
jgi:hypothetical protein